MDASSSKGELIMFCFQCEQTAKCTGCTGAMGVCGKKADTAALQDKLTGSLIGLARATDENNHIVSDSAARSEEHTSELQSPTLDNSISYAVFCL